MDFHVECPCGQRVTVNEGLAGSEQFCACGRRLKVPLLKELRQQAGVPHDLSPDLVIRTMLDRGQLPGSDRCASCGKTTHDHAIVTLECERPWLKDRSGPGWLKAIITIPAIVFAGVLGVFALWKVRDATVHGEFKVYDLPLAMCAGCQPFLKSLRTVKEFLCEVPIYRRLLAKYPDARILLVRGSTK